MPSKTKMKNAAIAARSAALPSIPKELIDQFVTGPMSGDAVNAASVAFKKALIERAMGAELSHHLGYPPGDAKPEEASNHRNGTSGKTVLTDDGPAAHRGAARPRGQLRAGADPQARAALHRLRRQDHRHVRARHDHARDPGLPAGELRRRGQP